MSIYRQFGVEPVINGAGTLTRLGGALMPDAVVEAMRLAARDAVPIEEMQGAASRILARITGCPAGLVTSGASAGLTLGSAAILAGGDHARIDRLPQVAGMPHEFLIAADQRNGYDHAVRAAGGTLTTVGMNERVAGAGVRGVGLADYQQRVSEQTAGVLYVVREGGEPRLADVVAWAHGRSLPVLVDAAAELPPAANLREIPGTGADLVVFSGGKGIRGPQATGILCGRRDLIESAAMQMLDMDEQVEIWCPPGDFIDRSNWSSLPRQGIGRGFKVAKEQIVGLLVALELFVHEEESERRSTSLQRRRRVERGLVAEGVVVGPAESASDDDLWLTLPAALTAWGALRELRQQKPAIYLPSAAESARAVRLCLTCVREDQEARLIAGIANLWRRHSSGQEVAEIPS